MNKRIRAETDQHENEFAWVGVVGTAGVTTHLLLVFFVRAGIFGMSR